MTTYRMPPGSSEAGFSLVEGLIAAALMLFIALGILPLFGQAMADNARGQSSTEVSNHGRSTLEEYFQIPFNDARMTVGAGTTELVVPDYYASGTDAGGIRYYYWSDTAPTGEAVVFDRTTTIRQYQIEDYTGIPQDVAAPLLGTPLAGDVDPGTVHVKEIDVEIDSNRRGGALGGGSRIRLRVVKPF